MKSLRESLFDVDKNIAKDMTFGDLFKLDEDSTHWKNAPLDKQFSALRIKKAIKVTGIDKCEIIFKGLVKVIEDFKLEGNPDDWGREEIQDELKKLIWNFFQYSLDNYKKSVYVGFYNHGALCLKDYSIFDHEVSEVNISLGHYLTLKFIRR